MLVIPAWKVNMVLEARAVFSHGTVTRYAKLRVAHAPGMPGTFPRHCGLAIPHASLHVRHARAVMHAKFAN